MTSLWHEALLIAEKRCFEKGHHHDGRNINVVYTEQAYAPAVCDECLAYADKIKNDGTMPLGGQILERFRKRFNHGDTENTEVEYILISVNSVSQW